LILFSDVIDHYRVSQEKQSISIHASGSTFTFTTNMIASISQHSAEV